VASPGSPTPRLERARKVGGASETVIWPPGIFQRDSRPDFDRTSINRAWPRVADETRNLAPTRSVRLLEGALSRTRRPFLSAPRLRVRPADDSRGPKPPLLATTTRPCSRRIPLQIAGEVRRTDDGPRMACPPATRPPMCRTRQPGGWPFITWICGWQAFRSRPRPAACPLTTRSTKTTSSRHCHACSTCSVPATTVNWREADRHLHEWSRFIGALVGPNPLEESSPGAARRPTARPGCVSCSRHKVDWPTGCSVASQVPPGPGRA